MTDALNLLDRIKALQLDHESFHARPHDVLREHRDLPFLITPNLGIPLFLRHADVSRMLNDPRLRQLETEIMDLRGVTEGPLRQMYESSLLFGNGEAHRARRAPLAKTFAYKLMESKRARVRAVGTDLLAKLKSEAAEKGGADFLNHFAAMIPGRIVAEIVGVPEEDVDTFIDWTIWAVKGTTLFADEDVPKIQDAIGNLLFYLREEIEDRRRNPRDDFLTEYTQATAEEGKLSEDEILTSMAVVLIAGSDTTRCGMPAVLSLLLQHPEQWEAFKTDSHSLKRAAVEEGLRMEPPAACVTRIATEDVTLYGETFPAGTPLVLSFLAGLRDPDVYAEPDMFNIHRTDHPRLHLTFGGGVHRCLGEALARAEIEECLALIADEAPDIRLAGPPPRVEGYLAIREIDRCQVAFG